VVEMLLKEVMAARANQDQDRFKPRYNREGWHKLESTAGSDR